MKLNGLVQKAEQILFYSNAKANVAQMTGRSSAGLGLEKLALMKARHTLTRPSTLPLALKSLFDTRADIIGSYVLKLKDSGHPIVGVANELCKDDPDLCSFSTSLQLRSILVLLVTKSLGWPSTIQLAPKETQEKVEAKQFSLSEITELIYTAHVLHRTIVNTSDTSSPLHQGNKLAALMGDLLLAKSSRQLSNLRNNRVTELMSQSICDFSESEFIGERNTLLNGKTTQFSPEHNIERFSYNSWLKRSELSLGSLLGHACFCSAIFASHDEAVQKFAFYLGKQIGLTLQVYKDIRLFEGENGVKMKQTQLFDPFSLPVIFEIGQTPELISAKELDFQKIFGAVQSSPTAIPRARESLLRMQEDSIRLVRQIESKTSASELLSQILESFSS